MFPFTKYRADPFSLNLHYGTLRLIISSCTCAVLNQRSKLREGQSFAAYYGLLPVYVVIRAAGMLPDFAAVFCGETGKGAAVIVNKSITAPNKLALSA
jgi:hypothetical protein